LNSWPVRWNLPSKISYSARKWLLQLLRNNRWAGLELFSGAKSDLGRLPGRPATGCGGAQSPHISGIALLFPTPLVC